MNKRQVQLLKKKPWWNYALLLAAIFLYTEACSLLYQNKQLTVQIPVIIFSMILHGASLKNLNMKLVLSRYMDKTQTSVEKITKDENMKIKEKSSFIANVVIQTLLVAIAFFIYLTKLKVLQILFLNIMIILIYSLVSVISYKCIKSKI